MTEERSFHEHAFHWHEFVENLERYHYGGYHPVQIGDQYSEGRYRIVHKLGFGSYSTVWLARDSKSNRYVALKIVIAEASEASTESNVLRHLNNFTKAQPTAKRFLTSLLDEFYIDGPNGRHLCLVTEPARDSVGSSKEDHPWVFPIRISRAIAAQAVLGLQTIHSSGIVHGDLHVRNLLLDLPPIDGMSVDEIYQHFHTPRKTPVHREDGAPLGPEVPPYSVIPMQSGISSIDVKDPRIRISDFGEAWIYNPSHPRQDLNTPVVYLPPETTFAKEALGFPADVWTLACSIFEIMGERTLFEGFVPDRDDIIAEMVSCLGPLPQHWWEAWEHRGDFFVDNGVWRTDMTRSHDPKSRPLLQRFKNMGRNAESEFTAAEVESLERMLRAMLEYEPAKRATVGEVVKSEWMTKWGLPALQEFDITI
ncbi:MAG: hypothetical protein Q9208_008436 [Pyrenodesmia sp. 3 TL-2023]